MTAEAGAASELNCVCADLHKRWKHLPRLKRSVVKLSTLLISLCSRWSFLCWYHSFTAVTSVPSTHTHSLTMTYTYRKMYCVKAVLRLALDLKVIWQKHKNRWSFSETLTVQISVCSQSCYQAVWPQVRCKLLQLCFSVAGQLVTFRPAGLQFWIKTKSNVVWRIYPIRRSLRLKGLLKLSL